MYHTAARDKSVWERLGDDDQTRKNLPAQQYSFIEGTTAQSSAPKGYEQSVKHGVAEVPILDPPLAALHRTTLEKYRRGHPVEFFAAIRPSTKTTTQTLRCALPFGSFTCTARSLPLLTCALPSAPFPARPLPLPSLRAPFHSFPLPSAPFHSLPCDFDSLPITSWT